MMFLMYLMILSVSFATRIRSNINKAPFNTTSSLCERYQCATEETPLLENECVLYQNNTYTIQSCQNGTCDIYGICKGSPINGECESDEDCEQDLRCSLGKCLPSYKIGDYGCVENMDCEITAACNATNGNRNGTCVPYFSVEVGQEITDCHDGISVMCSTSSCSDVGFFGNRGIC